MTKHNNKGFSLIDLIIAIAVMALLVSPIILQLQQTLEVSSQAKEKQYVVDSANEVLEYFRKYDKDEIVKNVDNEGILNVTNITDGTRVVKLYDASGNTVAYTKNGVNSNEIEINYKKYTLDQAKLGKKDTAYDRCIVMTDMLNKLFEVGLQVDYSLTSGSLPNDLATQNFVIRSDNTVVRTKDASGNYNTNMYDDAELDGIVVKPNGASSSYIASLLDPNTVGIGNVQDIDANKMAIITGDATSLDYQLESDLTAELIQFAATHPATAIGQLSDKPDQLNSYIKTLVNNASATSKTRLISLKVTAGENAVDTDGNVAFYHVTCDVYYKITFDGDELKIFNGNSKSGEFKYNVLDRDYYVDKAPDIYMVYEPQLLTTSTTGAAYYADEDFISITTDEYTSGADASKLYLIKSTDNWQKVTGTTTKAGEGYYTIFNGVYKSVDINITQDAVGAENQIEIYTNIDKSNLKAGSSDQFSFDPNSNSPSIQGSSGVTTAYDSTFVKSVSDELGDNADRLYQLTVTYKNSRSNEVTYISGAKGAD